MFEHTTDTSPEVFGPALHQESFFNSGFNAASRIHAVVMDFPAPSYVKWLARSNVTVSATFPLRVVRD